MNPRPGGVTAVCIIAILLGSLGLLVSLFGVAALVVGQERIQGMMPKPQGENEARAQLEMNDALNAVTNPLKPLTTTLMVLEILASSGLIVGSVMTLGLKEQGRKLLRNVLLLSIPLEIARSVVGAYVSTAVAEVNGKFMPMLVAGQPNGNKMPADFGENIAKIGMIVGLAWAAIWLLANLAFLITSWLYLNRPRVRAAFAAPTADDELA